MAEPSIYAKAIDVIRERGWFQDRGNRWGGIGPKGERCLGRALSLACSDHRQFPRHLNDVLGSCISQWNDAPERTVEDVYLLLKYADAGELETWAKLYGPEAAT